MYSAAMVIKKLKPLCCRDPPLNGRTYSRPFSCRKCAYAHGANLRVLHFSAFIFVVFKQRDKIPGWYTDFCDGDMYKEHPLFSCHSDALQLIIYTDEVEVANPLGSYRGLSEKHFYVTFTMHFSLLFLFLLYSALFYYMIGNIEPKLRSSLRSIQLIACCTYPLLQKYDGFKAIY